MMSVVWVNEGGCSDWRNECDYYRRTLGMFSLIGIATV